MYKLLIVEDEVEIRQGLKNYFPWEEIGYYIVGDVANGEEALAVLNKVSVDVVLSDIRMPVMSGIALARRIYEEKWPIKIVFLSAFKDFEYAQQALEYGVKKYIIKPTKYQELLEVFLNLKQELLEQKEKEIVPREQIKKIDASFYEDKVLSKIKAITHKEYKTITLQGIADQVNRSPAYISKYFKEKTGENYSDYLTKVRMEQAKKLLLDIHYKTYEVSELVGYTNAKNFTRAFRNYYGVTPMAFRMGDIDEEEKI